MFRAVGKFTGTNKGNCRAGEFSDNYDHALIYEENSLKPTTIQALESEKFRPTAENFARCFYEKLLAQGLVLKSVTVYETPDNCAVYEV